MNSKTPKKEAEYTTKQSHTLGQIYGMADVCRSFLFTKGDITWSRKIWLIAELIKQEILAISAEKSCLVNTYERAAIFKLFPVKMFQSEFLD